MIPEELRAHLARPVWLLLGSRDPALRPAADWAFGARPDGEQLTVVVAEPRATALIERLRDNGRLAVTANDVAASRCYQMKARFVQARPAAPADEALCDIHFARIAPLFEKAGRLPTIQAMRKRPLVAITARVEEVFEQTPGPNAGRRLGDAGMPAESRPAPPTAPAPTDLPPAASLPGELRPVLEELSSATVVTCARDGTPNCTVLSEVWWVDPGHVALSFQFFNKTARNVRENPFAAIRLMDTRNATTWNLALHFARSETEGSTFDAMEMRLEALASMMGLAGVFKLRAADVYRVLSFRRNEDEFAP